MGMLRKAAGVMAAALMLGGSAGMGARPSRGLSEEGQMLRMSKEDRLEYDKKRRKRKVLTRQDNKFDYSKRNKKLREQKRSRKINRGK